MPDSLTRTSDAMTQLNRADAERQLQRIKARTLIVLVAANTKAPSITDIQGVVTEYETADTMMRSVDLFCD